MKIAGGSKSKGYEYELVDEAENLRSELESAFEAAFEKIKVCLSGSIVTQI